VNHSIEHDPRRGSDVVPLPYDGRRRVLVEAVSPRIDDGRFPVKRVVGDRLVVSADVFCDGHDHVGAAVQYRHGEDEDADEVRMAPLRQPDRFQAAIPLDRLGRWRYSVVGWIDDFASWGHGLRRKADADQDVHVELLAGADLLTAAAERAGEADVPTLEKTAALLRDAERTQADRVEAALSDALWLTMKRYPDRTRAAVTEELVVVVDPPRARFSAWYEMFPRSCGRGTEHGTFRDAESRLAYVAGMGFDVLYLPPIHPIGRTYRKGKNNSLDAGPDDPGSPWAIGAAEGGHTAVHPELGTFEDFRRLVAQAEAHGLSVALDIAFQATPDHPWVKEHPEWFRKRPDGTIQYAENPPKKYQDIYPFDFETDDWEGLWRALRDVFLFWIDQGVTTFRVDNPHTKSMRFWEWCIRDVKERVPEAVFLSEAFTRPKLMYGLAKRGFTQSYTYFTWRNTKHELTEYLRELVDTDVAEYLRPSFWPNTPDILPEHLQHGGRGAFCARLVLASTLSSNWGIYGPAFELMEHVPRPGVEEYLDNEKYEIRDWDLSQSGSLAELIALVNAIRREHPALHDNSSLRFHETDNEELICYSKSSGRDVILVVVNLNYHFRHSGWLTLDLEALGLDEEHPFKVHDLVQGSHYLWQGHRAYVELDPNVLPAHVFHVTQRLRTEQDFDYY